MVKRQCMKCTVSFAGENFRELLKVGFSRLKLSRIVGNNIDTPIDNHDAVLNKNIFC